MGTPTRLGGCWKAPATPWAPTASTSRAVGGCRGEASFGANRRRASRSQIAILGAGGALTVVDAQPGTRFMLMAGKPYGERPVFNGPYVD